MQDTTRRDALERSLQARLMLCDEVEIDQFDKMMTAIEKRRDILEVQRQIAAATSLATSHRIERVQRANRGADITAALRELRDAETYAPRFTLIRGGEDQSS